MVLAIKIIGCGLLTYSIYTTIKSKKLNKEIKVDNYTKNINVNSNEDRIELYIQNEIKKITIFDIKNWIPKKYIYGYRLFENNKDAIEFGETLYGEWSRNLIDKYKKDYIINEKKLNPCKALRNYSGNLYTGINSYLRGNCHTNISYLKDNIKNIDISFSNVPTLEENIIVFRYIYLSEALRNYYFSLKEGDMIKDKAYISTSLIIDVAINHGRKIDDNFALLVIKVPKGENVIFVDTIDVYIEYEILISRNSTLEIEKILVKNDKQIVLLCELQK